MPKDEINTTWSGDEHEIDRERLLFRLARIESNCGSPGYYGSGNCKLCGNGTPYGSRSYGGVEWSIDIHHYIEYHGHKPSDVQLQAINLSFEEIKMKIDAEVRRGKFRMESNQFK